MAIAYAARYPERLTHLILWCTFARGSDYYGSAHFQAIRGVMEKDWGLSTEVITHERMGWSDAETARRFAALVRENVTREVIQAYIAAVSNTDVTPLLKQVRAPTLVLQCRDLPYPDVNVAGGLAAGIADARLTLLEGASLATFIPDPEEPMRLIWEFLGEPETVGPPQVPSKTARPSPVRVRDCSSLSAPSRRISTTSTASSGSAAARRPLQGVER